MYKLVTVLALVFGLSTAYGSSDLEMLKYPAGHPVKAHYESSYSYKDVDGDQDEESLTLDFSLEVVETFDVEETLLPFRVELTVNRLRFQAEYVSGNEHDKIKFDSKKLGSYPEVQNYLDTLHTPICFTVFRDGTIDLDSYDVVALDELEEVLSLRDPSYDLPWGSIDELADNIRDFFFGLAEVPLEQGERKELPEDSAIELEITAVSGANVSAKVLPIFDDFDEEVEISGSLNWKRENALKVDHKLSAEARNQYWAEKYKLSIKAR